MTRFLLDTNVVSELRKPKPHGAVIAWLKRLNPEQILLCAVTLGELQAGVERTRRNDPVKAAAIEGWIDQLAASYEVLPLDAPCLREWGRLRDRGPSRVSEDMMIAAVARVHGLVVATRNERDFENLEVEVLNPFTAP